MEEKILAKLDRMEGKFDEFETKLEAMNDKFETKFEAMDDKFETKFEEIDAKLEAMNDKFETKFEEMDAKFEKKFDDFELKIDTKLQNFRQEFREEIRKEILDHMFVFEEQYGRKLTIAVEALTSENNKEKSQNSRLDNLERISQMNTAYVYNHEDKISKLQNV